MCMQNFCFSMDGVWVVAHHCSDQGQTSTQTHTCTHGIWLLIISLTTSSSYLRVGLAWSAVCTGSLSQFNQLSVFISLCVHTLCVWESKGEVEEQRGESK